MYILFITLKIFNLIKIKITFNKKDFIMNISKLDFNKLIQHRYNYNFVAHIIKYTYVYHKYKYMYISSSLFFLCSRHDFLLRTILFGKKAI